MNLEYILSFLIPFIGTFIIISFVLLMFNVVFPFIQSLSSERRFQKFIDKNCLLGNEIAILIRRENTRSFYEKDYQLVRAAIKGNENAIKALKLDREKK